MSKKKKIPLILLVLAAAIGLAATTHDYFLLPENFFMHKGDKLNLHLLGGDVFTKQEEIGYQAGKTSSFMRLFRAARALLFCIIAVER